MRHYKMKLLKTVMGICMGIFIATMGCMNVQASETTQPDETVVPMSINVSKNVTLNISSGVATSSCKVSGNIGDVTKISITMYLQKKSSSGTYSTIQTWSGSKSSNYYNFSKTCSVSKGTYRVKAKITCYKGSTSETTTKYSTVKTY